MIARFNLKTEDFVLLNETLIMGNTTSVPETIDVDEITSKTGLSKKQIAALWTRFVELDRDSRGENKGYKGYIDVEDLRRIRKLSVNPIASRLLTVVFEDFATDGKLTFNQFVNFMSTFGQEERHRQLRPTALLSAPSTMKTDHETSKDESASARKINFIFRMYDIDHDGFLSKEDVEEILKMMVGKISAEEASIIAEKVIAEFTGDQPNSTVTVENFRKALGTIDFDDKMSLKLLKAFR